MSITLTVVVNLEMPSDRVTPLDEPSKSLDHFKHKNDNPLDIQS